MGVHRGRGENGRSFRLAVHRLCLIAPSREESATSLSLRGSGQAFEVGQAGPDEM
jgi:hypothetical protein